jgi:DNA invertase Pin-like site-specific DNA recombinase
VVDDALPRIQDMATMNAKYVTYCRVSTKVQGMDGNGMTSQTETVRRFVNSKGGQIVGEFCEVESGGKTDKDRPQLSDALRLCRKYDAILVVAKLDRLSRNAEFLLSLQNSNVDFVCCDCPNVDRFTVGILALVAQRERELISERTKSALKVVKARGVRLGTRDPERMVRIMVESNRQKSEEFRSFIRPIIEQIRQTGVTTLKGVADCLNRRGIFTRTGKSQWFPSTVKTVIG